MVTKSIGLKVKPLTFRLGNVTTKPMGRVIQRPKHRLHKMVLGPTKTKKKKFPEKFMHFLIGTVRFNALH